jgi:ABC-type branched-subunit amino acid transport system ATPase component/ABC-type branched-subunit amino acid transport system permease subunit
MHVGDSDSGGTTTPTSVVDRVPPVVRSLLPAIAIVVVQQIFLPVQSGLVVRGLIVGALGALVALGMALVYGANRIVNFAQVEMGFVPAVLAYLLMERSGWPYLVAVAAGLAAAVGLGAATERLVIRRFVGAPRLLVTIATLGLGQVFFAVATLLPDWWDTQIFSGRMPAPFQLDWAIGNVHFDSRDLLALVVAPLALVAVATFLQRSDVGVAVRAAADSTERASLLGIPVQRLQTLVWSLASTLAFVTVFLRSGILGVPTIGLALSLRVLFNALVALVLGRMTNLVGVTSAAVALGVLERGIVQHHGDDVVEPVLGLILVVVLLLRRREVAGGGDPDSQATWRAAEEVRRIPAALAGLRELQVARWVALGAVGFVALVLPAFLSGSQTFEAAALLIFALLGVSLVLLSGWGGIISLGHVAYFAVGAAVAAWAIVEHGVDLFPAMLLAALAGAVVATLVGIPGVRLRGIYLAVCSFGFALATTGYLLDQDRVDWVPRERVGRAPLLGGFGVGSQTAVYYLALVVLALAVAGVANLRRSRFGRALVALRDNDRAARSYAVDAIRLRLAAFALSGALAALAGALFVHHEQYWRSTSYGAVENLEVFTMVVVGGMTTLTGAVLGALYLLGTRWLLDDESQLLASGMGVLAVLLLFPDGLAGVVYAVRDRVLRAFARSRGLDLAGFARPDRPGPRHAAATLATRDRPGAGHPAAVTDSTPSGLSALPDGGQTRSGPPAGGAAAVEGDPVRRVGALLDVRDVRAGYDDVPVLFGVSLAVRDGEAVALLGTNGAGKSTLLRTISGVTPATGGTISFVGDELTGRPPHRIAASGVQQMPGGRGTFPSLTVAENLRVAGWLHRHDPAAAVAAVERVEAQFPVLAERSETRAADLSGGQQQMLALAMALLGRPRLLMIDELSLGLAPAVVTDLLHVVDALRDEGTTVVVVEQSVDVALAIADRAVFLERGVVRFDGPTTDLLDRPDLLRSVFLGRVAEAGPDAGGLEFAAARPVVTTSWPPSASDGDEPEPTPALSVQGLRVAFGGVVAVDDVSFDVATGEVVAVVGPNGAGKTTLFDLVSGFVRADDGKVLLDGADVTRMGAARRARRGLGRSFQDARLFPSLTVEEVLATAHERWVDVGDPLSALLHLPNVQDSELAVQQRVDELIALLGLDPYRTAFVSELSTGTRRIVDLACLLAHRPSVVLLDEPAAGIAQREVEQLPALIRRIRDELGASVLVVEHDLTLVQTVAERVVALDRGRVLAAGSPADVLADPAVVAAYLGDRSTSLQIGPTSKEIDHATHRRTS